MYCALFRFGASMKCWWVKSNVSLWYTLISNYINHQNQAIKMKDQLKIVFSAALISLFSIGCKKDSKQPSPEPSKFTVSSTTFKDGVVDHKLLWGLKSPQVSWKNVPNGTKKLLIIVKNNASDLKQQHIYWISVVKPDTEIKEERVSHDLERSVGDFNIPTNNVATECILEIVALKSSSSVSKESDNVLGIATATYKIVKPKIENKITPVTQDPGAAFDPVFATISHAFKME